MTTIERVTTTTVSVPLHTPFVTALRRTETTDTVVVTITDSDGRTGWGEAPQVWQVTGESLASATACIETMLAPVVTGRRLDDRDDLAAAASAVQRAVARNFGAKAAVDAALHDLVAQAEGTSVAAVLAARPDGIREVLTTDVTLSAGAADALADTARARVARGLSDPQDEGGHRRRHRRAARRGGPRCRRTRRRHPARRQPGLDRARRPSRSSGRSRSPTSGSSSSSSRSWPTTSRVSPGCASVSASRSWPTSRATDPSTSNGSSGLGAADLVNVKLAKCGSLTVGRDMLRRAHDAGLRTIVGSMMESHVGVGAAAALVAAEPTTEVSDLDAAWWSVHSPVDGGIAYAGNEIRVPTSAGFGITGFAARG